MQQNCSNMEPQTDLNIQQLQHMDWASNTLQPDRDAESEIQQNIGISLRSEHRDTDVVQKAENVMKTATTEAINLMRYRVEKKVEFVIVDYKLQELCQEAGAAKMRCLQLQMENESLSQEMDSYLKSHSGLALRVKNTLEICRILKEHLEKLQLTAEQIEKFRCELCIKFSGLSDDLNSRSKNRKTEILEYQKYVESSKCTVMEGHELRISEINDANSIYRQAQILDENMLTLKQEEEKNSALKLQDEELECSITEEMLKLKEKLKHAHESVQSSDCADQALKTNISSYENKQKELEKSLYGLTIERECLKRQSNYLEESLEAVSNEEKVLSAHLDIAKQELYNCEAELDERCKQEHTIETEIVGLLQQKYEFEDKLKNVSRKLEDTRTKNECLMQDVINLRITVENIRSQNQIISDSNKSELSGLESEQNIVKEEIDSEHTKLKEQKSAIAALQEELEKENTLQKSLQWENLKATATDENKGMEALRSFIEDEKTKSEELSRLVLVKQSEVEKLKEEVEGKFKERTDYEKEVLVALNQKREEIKAVKEKQEKMDSERSSKREEIMEGLRVCREASIKQADGKEAELNEQRKKNCSLKEELNSIIASKESMEKDLNLQKKVVECKIKQLKMDLEKENIQSTIRKKSETYERDSSLSKANLKSPIPSSISSQAYMRATRDDQVTSDSDRSSIDFCDLVNKLHSEKRTDGLQHQDSVQKRRFQIHNQTEQD